MIKYCFSVLFFVLCINISKASKNNETQMRRTCGTVMPSEQWKQEFRQKVSDFKTQQNNSQNRINANYTLPIIVHVVYWNANENISAAQINAQLDVLNADYAGTGFNVSNCPTAFQSLISNTNISFCPASKRPNGTTLPEVGIDRVNAVSAGFTNPGTSGWSRSYIDNTIKPATTWDATKYLNVWVLPLDNTLLGYATFPGGPANKDGVVIGYTIYGMGPSVSAPYDKGRTATHEVGHWLGVYHISGDEVCGDDECDDTPLQMGGNSDGENGLNYGCPSFPFQVNGCGAGSSPNGELFMNFMDYVNDACMYLFTPDQRTRMQTTMTNFSMRSALASSNVCTVAPNIPVANFSANRTAVCPNSTVNFTDLSTGIPTSWSWSITPNTGWNYITGSSASSQNPKVNFSTAGNYTVALTATNGLGADVETKNNYINVATPTGSSLPFAEGFQGSSFPPSAWSLTSASTFNWERNTAVGGFGLSNACMYFNNYDNDADNKKDDINSPIINLNGAINPRLKFDVAYAPYLEDNGTSRYDTLEVLITDFCANSTTSIYKKGGTQLATAPAKSLAFAPNSAQWRIDSVNIPAAFLNKQIKITFRNYGKYANNIFIDNVNMYNVITSTCTGIPTANFTSSASSVCSGASLTFTNTSTSSSGTLDSIRWTNTSGTPNTSTAASYVPTYNTAGSFTVTLKAYKCGNVNTKSQVITVNAKPNVTVTSPSICSGETATVQASGASTYSWSNGLGTGNPKTTPILSSNTNYTVTGTDANNCTGTAVATITVKPKPTTPIITQGHDTLYSSINLAGASYDWYKNGVFHATTSTRFIRITQAGTYTLIIRNNGCSSISSTGFNATLTAIIKNKLAIQLAIVPNPNNGAFDINIVSPAYKNYTLSMFTIAGQEIYTDEFNVHIGQNNKRVSIPNLEKGIYLISIIGEEGTSTQTILVQ